MNSSGKFVPYAIAAFFVLQAILFVWFYNVATSTYSGLVTEGAYEKGLKYNQTINQAEKQKNLGWTSSIKKKNGGVEFILKDKNGSPLSGAHVILWLVRLVHDGADQHLEMKETSPGHYFSAAVLPEKGLWEARVESEKDGKTYQTARRMEF